ncbi:MAG: hypothetical protein HY744_32555 [Deltaproteobacteria bacterium]|nr:hypothetical protein [Deltaproteobacteria bacterium]
MATATRDRWCWRLGVMCALAQGCATAGRESGSGAGQQGQGGQGGGSVGFDAGSSSGSACSVAAEQESNATCKVAVVIGSFTISDEACWVDSPLVEGDPGELKFACGDGPAELSFPTGKFVGTAKSCVLDLELTTQFDWIDGCTWQSQQAIVGPMEGQLDYAYSEHPIVGAGCAQACTVHAVLSLGQSGPVEVEPPK